MNPLSIECDVTTQHGRGRKELEPSPEPLASDARPCAASRPACWLWPHRLERLVRTAVVKDYAEAARLGHVTRARVSQILSLLYLAPDIQETILFLFRVERGGEPAVPHELLPIAAAAD